MLVIQVAKQAHGQVLVHNFAVPAGDTGFRVNETVLELLLQVDDYVAVGEWPVAHLRNDFAKFVAKYDSSLGVAFATESALVHQPKMMPAELHEVVETRFAAICLVPLPKINGII